jgi:polyribonucleotide nucleotidyltransferase
MHILDAMYQCIPEARSDVKPHAPRMVKLFIDREYIGAVIGPGGKVIQEMQRETGTTINIEEKNNMGEVSIFGSDKEKVEKAHNWIKGIVAVPVVGDEYEAVVKTIQPYGAFVEFLPGKQGLLHISEVSWKRLETLEGVLNEGDKVKVKLTGTDPKTGKFKLSRKVLLPKPEGMREERPRDDRQRDERPRDDRQREGGYRSEAPRTDRPKLEKNQNNGGQQSGTESAEGNEQ